MPALRGSFSHTGAETVCYPLWAACESVRARLPARTKRRMGLESLCAGTGAEIFGAEARCVERMSSTRVLFHVAFVVRGINLSHVPHINHYREIIVGFSCCPLLA